MRRSLPFLILALACVAHADRVITVPRGGKISLGTLRTEYMFEASHPESTLTFFGVGVTTFIDAEIVDHNLRDQKSFTELDLNFNVNAPLAGFAPGLSFGLLDAADQSPEGRRGYVAFSIQDGGGSGILGGNAAVETTLGAIFGRESRAFVGMSLPVNERFRLLAEADGRQINAGVELRLHQGPFFKAIILGRQTMVSAGATIHF